MRVPRLFAGALLVGLAVQPLAAQVPLGIKSARGQSVTPVFEGWYVNADGTYTISFGYFNRNDEEVLEIPLGDDNAISPAAFDGDQPTRFESDRHWGVFGIVVPADFGEGEVVWTLRNRGGEFSIPGNLHPDWQIDALAGEAGVGNTPPILKIGEGGAEAQGPLGTVTGPIAAKAGVPTEITVWARDDGRGGSSVVGASRNVTVSLMWFKHRGPGKVAFEERTATIEPEGGSFTTAVTFAEPGDYLLRVRANDSSVSSAGHAQCCWTNAFIEVTVN